MCGIEVHNGIVPGVTLEASVGTNYKRKIVLKLMRMTVQEIIVISYIFHCSLGTFNSKNLCPMNLK
jgi:hypothetical protein